MGKVQGPLPTLSRLSKVSIQREWVPKKPVNAAGINPGATASGPTVCPSHTAVTHIQRVYLALCWLLPCLAGIGELPLAQLNCFSGTVPIMVLTSLFIFSCLTLFGWSLGAQPSAPLWVSTCFPQLLDEGSMMTFKIFINLTTKQGQIRHPLLYYLGS